MTSRRANVLSLVFIGIVVAMAAFLYAGLPDPMPSHWNTQGQVDGYLPRFWGVSLLPLIAIGVMLVMRIIPLISPKGFRSGPFAGVLNIFQVMMVGFTSAVGVLVLLEAKGLGVPLNEVIFIALGLLFIATGRFFGKLRKNLYLGIRTPWTLASDEVWNRTHRLGGRLFVLMGVVMMLGAWFPGLAGWTVGFVVVIAVVPVVYSYFIFRRIRAFGQ
ncbi:MAG TPA: SdpI family protein [Woeseiaceae bacterium]|nr:SdpI family protein [Woeseiaceae bacterium]